MDDDLPNRPLTTLHLTGAFRATDAAGADIGGLSRRGQALLAVLSQRRDFRAERSWLADLLWSDRGEDQARASLRQELSVLRRALPEGVMNADRQHVWLDSLAVAVAAPEGAEFLEGFGLASEGFEDWLRDTRSSFVPDPAATPAPNDKADTGRRFFDRPAVLLLSFEALSSGEQDQMIATGLADDLRLTLSYWRWFPVIGPEAIGWKTAKEVDLRATAAEVQAAYVVTGTIRCLGNRVKITVGLTEAATGRARWTQQFTGTLDDIFDFQEDVSRAIVAQLEPQIASAEATRIARARPSSIGPWQLMAQADEIERLKGEGYGYGTPDQNFAQVKLMEKALELAPDLSLALSGIARIQFRAGLLGWVDDRAGAFATSISFSERAMRADPENWEAHAFAGLVRIFGYQDYPAGQHHSLEAVRLNPSAALARQAAGCAAEWLGKPEEALEHLRLIFRLNPNYNGRAAALGDVTTCEMFLDRRDEAVEASRRLMAIAPDYARGLQRCVATFGYFGETEAAANALARLRAIQPDFDADYVRETYPYARQQDLQKLLTGLSRAGAFAT